MKIVQLGMRTRRSWAGTKGLFASLAVMCLAAMCLAQTGPPRFNSNSVLPSGGTRPVPLAPEMILSIYGTNLGPASGCIGQADPHQLEPPSPLLEDQRFINKQVYPKELCG
ncbi:MAG TPA: hypothetical protein VFW83_07520, partial [Bryobacteraceae bacterium]|nr:hypothetical protein [Bryobacteraceae bacterium]